jgi:hypothetical protein
MDNADVLNLAFSGDLFVGYLLNGMFKKPAHKPLDSA